jgi:hypothetical protein
LTPDYFVLQSGVSLQHKVKGLVVMAANEALDPRTAMDLVDSTTRDASRALSVDEGPLFLAWGVAWVLGYGAAFLSIRHQHPYTGPDAWAYVVLAVSLGLAATFTGIVTGRASSGVDGPSAQSGLMYGLSWPIGFVALFSFVGALGHAGASDRIVGLVASAGPALVVGVIYVVGAAIWRSTAMFALGAWLCLVVAVGAYAGVVNFSAIMAIAGGGGFLVTGATLLLRGRR